MRTLCLASLVAALAGPAIAAAGEPVYLDDSKTYDAIRAADPARYDKIIEVLRVAQVEPCETLPTVLKTRLDVNAKCQGYVIYTSFPAKTRLHFTVDKTEYVAYVVQSKLSGGKLIPAR